MAFYKDKDMARKSKFVDRICKVMSPELDGFSIVFITNYEQYDSMVKYKYMDLWGDYFTESTDIEFVDIRFEDDKMWKRKFIRGIIENG